MALTVRVEPMTMTGAIGAGPPRLPIATGRPAGDVVTVTVLVSGEISTVSVSDWPPASVTDAVISSLVGASWSGATMSPLAPVKLTSGWSWQLPPGGQCLIVTVQSMAADRSPSWASVALPETWIVSPTRQVSVPGRSVDRDEGWRVVRRHGAGRLADGPVPVGDRQADVVRAGREVWSKMAGPSNGPLPSSRSQV